MTMLFQTVPATSQPECAMFSTDLGQAGVVVLDESILRLSVGHSNEAGVLEELKKSARHLVIVPTDHSPWLQSVTAAITRFCAGEPTGFEEFSLWLEPKTLFQQQVFQSARAIPYGQTRSYRHLAESVGSPRAARAIGNVMASNPLPILIPCHRVIGSDGKLHGFSAPQGTDLKQQLLHLESRAVER